jgi:hypothetical protein
MLEFAFCNSPLRNPEGNAIQNGTSQKNGPQSGPFDIALNRRA